MKGSVTKRCRCPVVKNARGDRIACKKPHGSWSFVVDLGSGPGGKRQQHRSSGYPTREDAERELREFLARLDRGAYHRDERKTLEQWLEGWIEAKRLAGLRSSTVMAYRQHMRLYLVPHLGQIRLRDLRPAHVSRMIRDIAAQEGAPGSATLHRIHATLRSALSSAVKAQIVPYNAAKLVELPKVDRPKVRPWEPHELGQFLDHVAADRLGPLFELLAMTGLRRGEALALRWDDVDLERGALVVRLSKTKAGEGRRVDVGPALSGMLLGHRLSQDAERTAWGGAYVDDGLVFARENGSAYDPSKVTKRFRRLAIEAGVRPVRLHDLRHGAASLMLAGGMPLALVSKRLGHSSITITSDTYLHLLEDANREAARVTESMVPRASRDLSISGTRATVRVRHLGDMIV